MLEKDEFERWIKASHNMFEIFEGRYDAYPLARKWAQEWFSLQIFTVNEEDRERVDRLLGDLNYEAYRNFKDRIETNDDLWRALIKKVDQQFKILVGKRLKPNKFENIGFAIAPFLFTWNFQRFKEYFKRRDEFSLDQYFRSLGEFLEDKRGDLGRFRNKRLIHEQIEKEIVERIFNEINDKLRELGIKNNEPVGVIKLLHVLAPFYFPLIDNDEGRAIGLLHSYSVRGRRRLESLRSGSYLKWMSSLKRWLQNYLEVIEKLENELHSSILKLVDEGLYLMCTVKLKVRVRELEIELK